MMKKLACFAFLAVLSLLANLRATEIIYDKKAPNWGINVYPLAEQAWRSKVMTYPAKVTPKEWSWIGPDFFKNEYGCPLVFNKETIKKFDIYYGKGEHKLEGGNLVFTPGKKGFYFGFGGIPNDKIRPGNQFGGAWGKYMKDRYRMKMVMEQDVAETSWTFCYAGHAKYEGFKKFNIKGKGKHEYEVDLGFVRTLSCFQGRTGLKFTCNTPGATIKIKSIKIAPVSAYVYFRKTFNLKEKPILAHATFQSAEVYDLYVNGQKVSEGNRVYPSGKFRTVNLQSYLQKGKNYIAFRREFVYWIIGKPDWLIEGIAVDKDGSITRILGDKSWKCAIKAGSNWMKKNYNDTAWKTPKLSNYFKTFFDYKSKVDFGTDPKHMGMLDVQIVGQDYPVFDYKIQAEFKVTLPLGVKHNLKPQLKIFKAGTDNLVKTVTAGLSKDGENSTSYTFKLNSLPVGPYRLIWELLDSKGKVVESRREELIVVGPIKQEQLKLADFEENFEKRLKLVQHIDCTNKNNKEDEFIDHAGMCNPPKLNKGKVIQKNGMTYRETGKGKYDYFAYRLHLYDKTSRELKDRGKPFLIEVIIPDNAKRYICSGVIEQFPLMFCNNPKGMGRYTATGTCLTGERFPITNKKRKLRYLYYPKSNCAAVVVMNGLADSAAAACEINVYRIEGDLPALAIPKTERMFGSHNERISVMQLTMASENPLEGSLRIRSIGHRDAWFNWYKAIERKIKWMRFQGRNMTVEGVYMYSQGAFPSQKHNRYTSNDEFDIVHLAAQMYEHNNINLILGFEYVRSPWYDASGMVTTSDRKMWQGAECDHMVDRYGRQIISGSASQSGGNFLQPKIRGLFMDTLGEICDRYKNVGKVNGIFIVNGLWWMPGFLAGSFKDIEDIEVGYGDYTVNLFEKETGIKLNIPAIDPKRFEKRYQLLTGKHKHAWLNWRAKKIREFFGMVEKRLQKNKWKVYSLAQTLIPKNNPFADKKTTRFERDSAMKNAYKRFGMPLELYSGNDNIQIVPKIESIKKFTEENVLKAHGWNTNPGTTEIIKQLGAVYWNDPGLNEIDNPAHAAKKWLWKITGRGVFTARGVEDNCMDDLVDLLPICTPKTIFYAWLDCNMTTAYGAQLRRFTKAFYATPEVEFQNLPAASASGVVAQSAAKADGAWLRLINNSPYELKGYITLKGKRVRDLVYDRDLESETSFFSSKEKYLVTLKPNDVRIFDVDGKANSIYCEFHFEDRKIAQDITNQAVNLLKVKNFLRKVPGDKISEMYDALARKDAFALYNLLDDYEVSAKTMDVEKELEAVEEQRKLIADLAQTGHARIICGSKKEYIDPSGNRWSPDQRYEAIAGAYGNENAYPVDRGNLAIGNTDMDRVYQTEVYGNHVAYHIPVPKGKYNVYLHFAETYGKNKRVGARLIDVNIEQRKHHKKIDPFAMSGGFAKALVLKEQNIPVYDGVIDIELSGNVALNGIEIEATEPVK